MTFEECERRLGLLLRDQPQGTTAEFADYAIAFWTGNKLVYCFLREDGSGEIDEAFNPAAYLWEDLEPDFAAWVRAPHYHVRSAVIEWRTHQVPSSIGA